MARRQQAEEAHGVTGVSNEQYSTASKAGTDNVGSALGSVTIVTTATFTRFKLLPAKILSATSSAKRGQHRNGNVEEEMQFALQKVNQHVAEATTLGIGSETNAIKFWNDRAAS